MAKNVEDFKLGPKVAPPLTLDATVRVIRLEPGKYALEPTVSAHVVQGDAEGVGTANDATGAGSAPAAAVDTQAEMANVATDVPGGSEYIFDVDDADPFVAFCAQVGVSAGTLKVMRRDRGRRA